MGPARAADATDIVTPTDPRSLSGEPRSGRGRVDDVSVVLLTHPDGPPLDEPLDALAAQSTLPHRLLLTGLDPAGDEVAAARRHALLTERRVPLVVRAPLASTPEDDQPGMPSTWRVLEDARGALPVHEDHWLWILHDDSLPEPGALEALAAAVRRNPRAGVVGPKLVRLDDPRLLVGVGHHVTVGGRAADPSQAALVDQGQLDQRQDVLGVPLAGSLVRSDVLDAVGGVDSAFGEDGVVGLDLGWRSQLVGQRVVVATDAVVRQGDTGLGVVDPRRTRIRRRQIALARGPAWASFWRGLGIAVTSALAALLLLLVKRPEEAADEWADVRAVLSPRRGWGARSRFRARRTVRPRDLAGLFLPAGTGWRGTLDTVSEALDPRDRSDRERGMQVDGRSRAGVETGPVADEFAELGQEHARRRLWSWPLALALLASVVVTGWWWRHLLGALDPDGPGVAGAELGAATTDAAGLWRSALDGWRGGGLGHDQPAEPWLLPLAAVTRLVEVVPGGSGFATATAGVALGWILVAAAPASVLTAYLALRRTTRRPWLRAGMSLGWAGLAPLTVAVSDGRVGPALVHVLAPLLVAGYVVSASRAAGVRRAAAVFATVLGVALAAQWVPLILLLATLGGLLLLVVGRGPARWRGLVLAFVPWLLLLPWWPAVVSGPTRLLGGAGATSASAAFPAGPPAWQVLLLQPGQPVTVADGLALSPSALALWLTVPLWLAALAALVVRGSRGRRAGVLVATAVAVLALAVLASRVSLGVLPVGHEEAGQTVTAWSGSLLSVAGAALLLAAGAGLDRLLEVTTGRRPAADLAEEETRRPGPLAGLGVTVTSLAVLAGVAALAVSATAADPPGLQPATDPLPAVASEQARGPASQRTLVLVPTGGATATEPGTDQTVVSVMADLRGVEPEPARILRDRARDLVVGVPEPGEVEETVAAIVGQGSPDAVEGLLEDLGVGYLLVEAPETDGLVQQVDRLPGLTRVSSPEGQVLWRMIDNDAARVRVLGADGQLLVRPGVTGPHGATHAVAQDLPDGASLDVAEGDGWARHATVRVDDDPVAPGPGGAYPLPPGTHELDVDVRTPRLPWHVLALVLAAVVAFLALPFGKGETDHEEQVR